MTPMRDAAEQALASGYSVFPIQPRSKLPAVRWKPYQTTPPTPAVVRRWWTTSPRANIGIACGRVSNLSVVDLDPKNDPTGETAAWLVGIMGQPPTVRSGSGGSHWYFPGSYPTVRNLRPGLDFISNGGYVIAPPSVHENGQEYVRVGEVGTLLPYAILQAVQERMGRELGQSRKDKKGAGGGTVLADGLTLEDVLGLLEGVRAVGRGWVALCPSHDDHSPSLGVDVGAGGRLLLKCYAGRCTFPDIVRALRNRECDRVFAETDKMTRDDNWLALLSRNPRTSGAPGSLPASA